MLRILVKKWNLLTFWAYWKNNSALGQINYEILYDRIFNTKELLFLWWPQISGSFSPFMHNYSSDFLEKEENKFIYKLNKIDNYNILDVENFIKKLENNKKYLWANITMPYKIDVYNYLNKLNRLEKNAKLVWAVNTLFKKDWIIYWTNTDLEWIKNPILEKVSPLLTREGPGVGSVYILWAWGASRAAIATMIELKIENVFVLNRNQKNLDEIKNHFNKKLWENQKLVTIIYDVENNSFPEVENKSIIINTLPFWFKENLPKLPIKFEDLDKIKNNIELYFEAVYDFEKWDTPIVEEIICRGAPCGYPNIKICRWVEMLIWQAKTWFELWSNGGEFKSEELKNILIK